MALSYSLAEMLGFRPIGKSVMTVPGSNPSSALGGGIPRGFETALPGSKDDPYASSIYSSTSAPVLAEVKTPITGTATPTSIPYGAPSGHGDVSVLLQIEKIERELSILKSMLGGSSYASCSSRGVLFASPTTPEDRVIIDGKDMSKSEAREYCAKLMEAFEEKKE